MHPQELVLDIYDTCIPYFNRTPPLSPWIRADEPVIAKKAYEPITGHVRSHQHNNIPTFSSILLEIEK
jgi:hypothetical protein